MIDRISCKPQDPSGQLEVIKIRNCPLGIIFKKNPNLALACNQLIDINHIIDFARHNLVFSSENMSRNFIKKFMNTDDTDSLEAISILFLSNSILFFNSSFDYLWILMRILYSSHEALLSDFSIEKIENEIKNKKIQKDDWEKALFKIISDKKSDKKINYKYYKENWINENKNISDIIKENFSQLNKRNETLKTKYQANDLKHGRFPYFQRSNPQNIIGVRFKLSMEQFYLKSGRQGIAFGIPPTGLNIDDVQNFLIDYNNQTVKLVNLIIEEKLDSDSDSAV